MEIVQPEQSLHHYARAYQQVYHSLPKDMRILGNGWVSVNGARMRVVELEFLAEQLEFEYQRQAVTRRGIVQRLISWFSK
jgi:hypothetical protein